MCSWDRYCRFAREQEQRLVGSDANVSVNGVYYQVDTDLADRKVTIWWGLFDDEIYVQFEDQKYGPYRPCGAPIPLDQYRAFRKTKSEKRAEKIEKLAEELTIPKDSLATDTRNATSLLRRLPNDIKINDFSAPDPFEDVTFPDQLSAKLAISDYLRKPIASLSDENREKIHEIVNATLVKKEVFSMIRKFF